MKCQFPKNYLSFPAKLIFVPEAIKLRLYYILIVKKSLFDSLGSSLLILKRIIYRYLKSILHYVLLKSKISHSVKFYNLYQKTGLSSYFMLGLIMGIPLKMQRPE